MRSQVQLLDAEGVDQILTEGCALLSNPGILIENQEALDLLRQAAAGVNEETQIAHNPENLARQALASCPDQFWLYDLDGNPSVNYDGDHVHFDPEPAAFNLLDAWDAPSS